MIPNPDSGMTAVGAWSPPAESVRQAAIQARLLACVVWFGLCGMMLSGLLGTERFLIQELSLRVFTNLTIAFCVIGILCAVRGSWTSLQLLFLRVRLVARD